MPVSIRFIVAVFILITAALLSQLNVEWRLKPQLFRRSPAATTGVMDHSFSAERCADLHNRLLQKAIVNEPGAVVERNLIARLVDASRMFGEIPNFDSSPLYHFFSLLDITPLPHGQYGLLTPEIYQPVPEAFFSDMFSHEPDAILLYGQNNADSPMDGGLFLNLQTYKVAWHWSPGRFPAYERWVSLEFALQTQLDKWESGKFYWDTDARSLAVKRWIEADVTDALYAWDRLLLMIEAKLPQRGQKQLLRLEPLSIESMSSFQIGSFAGEFLRRAPRPEFKHVAPGISTFSPETLYEIYSAEPTDSFRRTFNIGDPDMKDWASLVLPASGMVSRDVSQKSDFDIKSFDEDWGYGKFTVSRRAGLYIGPDIFDSDVVRFIANSGLPSACQFDGLRPWGPSRSPRLSEVLHHWALLVENGIWKVDADGVANDNSWFDANIRQSKLNWVRT